MYKEKAEVKCTDYQYPDLSIYIWLSLNVPPASNETSMASNEASMASNKTSVS